MKREVILEACARAAHETNRAYCLALGDTSQPPWAEAPDWQRASAREGVAGVLAGNTPEQSHEAWLRGKKGWVYGPVKNPDVDPPMHPCLVPYADLPPEQRAKDDVFVSVVRAVAKALGATIAGA